MSQRKITFVDKVNYNPVTYREKQICAADINEIKDTINDNAVDTDERFDSIDDNSDSINKRLSNLESNQYSGVITFTTYAKMIAQTSPAENTAYKVTNDATDDNNGYWHYDPDDENADSNDYVQDRKLTTTTELIQFYNKINSKWIYKGECDTDSETPVVVEGYLYVPTENGTIFDLTISDYKTQVIVGGESSFNVKYLLAYHTSEYDNMLNIKNYGFDTSAGVGATISLALSSDSNLNSGIINCEEGDVFIVNGSGGESYLLWCFVDADLTILTCSDASLNVYGSPIEIEAPENAAYLVCNNAYDSYPDAYVCKRNVTLEGYYAAQMYFPRFADIKAVTKSSSANVTIANGIAVINGIYLMAFRNGSYYDLSGLTLDFTDYSSGFNIAYIEADKDFFTSRIYGTITDDDVIYHTFANDEGDTYPENAIILATYGGGKLQVPLMEEFVVESQTIETINLQKGGYLDSDTGEFTSSSSWYYSERYDINEIESVNFSVLGFAGACEVAFYDDFDEFISGLTGTDKISFTDIGDAPDDTRYIRFCHISAQTPKKYIRLYSNSHWEQINRLLETTPAMMYNLGAASKSLDSTKKIGIITAGQSNTDGRVPIADLPDDVIFPMTGCNIKTSVSSSFATFEAPDYWAFDTIVYNQLTQVDEEEIYVMKYTQGGTGIDKESGTACWTAFWQFLDSGQTSLLRSFERTILAGIEAEGDNFEIRAFLWHQGEGDSLSASNNGHCRERYYNNLKMLIAYVRGVVGNPILPFIYGTVSTQSAQYDAYIHRAMTRIADEDPYSYLVDMGDASLLDDYHFDADNSELFGKRVYDVLVDIGVASGDKFDE